MSEQSQPSQPGERTVVADPVDVMARILEEKMVKQWVDVEDPTSIDDFQKFMNRDRSGKIENEDQPNEDQPIGPESGIYCNDIFYNADTDSVYSVGRKRHIGEEDVYLITAEYKNHDGKNKKAVMEMTEAEAKGYIANRGGTLLEPGLDRNVANEQMYHIPETKSENPDQKSNMVEVSRTTVDITVEDVKNLIEAANNQANAGNKESTATSEAEEKGVAESANTQKIEELKRKLAEAKADTELDQPVTNSEQTDQPNNTTKSETNNVEDSAPKAETNDEVTDEDESNSDEENDKSKLAKFFKRISPKQLLKNYREAKAEKKEQQRIFNEAREREREITERKADNFRTLNETLANDLADFTQSLAARLVSKNGKYDEKAAYDELERAFKRPPRDSDSKESYIKAYIASIELDKSAYSSLELKKLEKDLFEEQYIRLTDELKKASDEIELNTKKNRKARDARDVGVDIFHRDKAA